MFLANTFAKRTGLVSTLIRDTMAAQLPRHFGVHESILQLATRYQSAALHDED
jgi:hypothetical protein